MKNIISNQKNNLEKLSKVLEIGTLINLGFNSNGQWIAEYTSIDDTAKNGSSWFPIHNCFTTSASFHLLSS